MRTILRRHRTRSIVVAAALAGGLVFGPVAKADADIAGPHDQPAAPLTASAAEAAEAAGCSSTYLREGSAGACVRLLQTNLGGLAVTGVYGAETRSRVRAFQDDTGLNVNGNVGPETWRKLRTYGKAVAWVSGLTVYMCEKTSTLFRHFAWNNSGRTAWFTFDTIHQDFGAKFALTGSELPDDRVVASGWENIGPYSGTSLRVGNYDNNEIPSTTTNVRDFSKETLPTCG